ncbi:hypothetical protein C8R44DRAFT_849455 [Mycena epipterygia]|nr:hypothetical protein C8R44DRAFT_849455 [Mycena epipterygia]
MSSEKMKGREGVDRLDKCRKMSARVEDEKRGCRWLKRPLVMFGRVKVEAVDGPLGHGALHWSQWWWYEAKETCLPTPRFERGPQGTRSMKCETPTEMNPVLRDDRADKTDIESSQERKPPVKHTEQHKKGKYLDNRSRDLKSDAGRCTGKPHESENPVQKKKKEPRAAPGKAPVAAEDRSQKASSPYPQESLRGDGATHRIRQAQQLQVAVTECTHTHCISHDVDGCNRTPSTKPRTPFRNVNTPKEALKTTKCIKITSTGTDITYRKRGVWWVVWVVFVRNGERGGEQGVGVSVARGRGTGRQRREQGGAGRKAAAAEVGRCKEREGWQDGGRDTRESGRGRSDRAGGDGGKDGYRDDGDDGRRREKRRRQTGGMWDV